MTQTSRKKNIKMDLYKALTGFGLFDNNPGVNRFSGHPVSLDSLVEEERDKALVLVKKMERQYNGDDPLAKYYQPCFERVDKAYLSGNHENFRKALQFLIDSIYME